eukprot:g11233.t1
MFLAMMVVQVGKKNKDSDKRRALRKGEEAFDPAQAKLIETMLMVPQSHSGRSTTHTPPESPDSSRSPPRACLTSLVAGTTPLPTTINTPTTRAAKRRKGRPGGKAQRPANGGSLQAPPPGKATCLLTMEELSKGMLTEEAIRAAAGSVSTRELHDVTALALVVDSSQVSVEGVWEAVPNLHTLTLDGSRLLSFRDLGVGLRHLNTLSLESSFVEELDGIGALSGLRELRLAHNRVSDVTPLACHATLQVLSLERNRVSDIKALEILSSLPLLYSLNLSGNPLMESLSKLRDGRGRGVVHKLIPQIKVLDGTHLSSREGDPVDAQTLDEADDLVCQGASRARAAWAEEEETAAAAAAAAAVARIDVTGEIARRDEGRRREKTIEGFAAGSGESSSARRSKRSTAVVAAAEVTGVGHESPPRQRPEQGGIMHWDSDLTQGGRQALSGNPRYNTQQSAERVSEWRRETCADSVPVEDPPFAPLDAPVPSPRLGAPPLSSSALEGGFDRQLRLGAGTGGIPVTNAWASVPATSAASVSIASAAVGDDGGRGSLAVVGGNEEQRISSGRPWTTGGLAGRRSRPTPPGLTSETPGNNGRADANRYHGRTPSRGQNGAAAAEEEDLPGYGEKGVRPHHPHRRRPQTAKEFGKRSSAPNPDDSNSSWRPVWESLKTAELISTPRLTQAKTAAANSKEGRMSETSSTPAGSGGDGRGGERAAQKIGNVDFGRQRRARATVRVAQGQDVHYLNESDDAYSTPEEEGTGTKGGDDSENAGDRAQIKKRALEFASSAFSGVPHGTSYCSSAGPTVVPRSPPSPPPATTAMAAVASTGSHGRTNNPRPPPQQQQQQQQQKQQQQQQASTSSESKGQLRLKARRRETASLRSRRSLAVMDGDTCSSSSSSSSEDEGGCALKSSGLAATSGGGEQRPGRDQSKSGGGDGLGGAIGDAGRGGGGGGAGGSSSSPRRESSIHASRMLGFDLRKSLAAIDEWTDKTNAAAKSGGCGGGTPRRGAAKTERGYPHAPFFIEHTTAADTAGEHNSPVSTAVGALNQAAGREAEGKSWARMKKADGVVVTERPPLTMTIPQEKKKNHGDPANIGIHFEDIGEGDDDDDDDDGEAVLSVAAARAALGISKDVAPSTATPRGRSARGCGAPSITIAERNDPNGPAGACAATAAAIEQQRNQRDSNSSNAGNADENRRGADARGDRWVPSVASSRKSTGGAEAAFAASPGVAVGMSDEELKGMLKQQPRMVPELRTKESFREFFQGMEAERMGRLLREAYEGNLPADQVDKKVKKRLGLVNDILAW